MGRHPNYRDNMIECPCCRGLGSVANCPCCSSCCGSGVLLEAPEIKQLGGTSPYATMWYVRRVPRDFPFGPGSRYLHVDGTWHNSPTSEKKIGEFPGFYSSEAVACHALQLHA